MSTMSNAVLAPSSSHASDVPERSVFARFQAIAPAATVILVSALAIATRAAYMNAPFSSSDQVALPHMIRHFFGLKWLFAHDYGPAVAGLLRGFAEVVSRLGLANSEASARLPVVVIGVAQVGLTYPLLRRLRCGGMEALAGVFCVAVLPTLVTDSRYPWGYLTISLFFGTTALWATLAYLDDRRNWQLLVAGLALTIHCLSNCYAFALPLTVLAVWIHAIRAGARPTASCRSAVSWRPPVMGFLLPCAVAVGVIVASWLWTGQGQLGRLIVKQQTGTSGWHPELMTEWWVLWVRQFGYLGAPLATAGLVYGIVLLGQADRRGWLGMWALGLLVPFVLAIDPGLVGHPGSYLIDAVFCGGLLAVLLVTRLLQSLKFWRRLRIGLAAVAVAALGHMAVGGVDDCLAGGHLRGFTGVDTGWGNVRADSGIKAAGFYVREHVPTDAVIMSVHTNTGMEVTIAEYYTGRYVVAGYDLPADILPPLTQAMHEKVDVWIVAAEHRHLIAPLEDFGCVATLRHGPEPVRFVYARPGLGLAREELDVAVANEQYDRKYGVHRIPLALSSSPQVTAARARFTSVLRTLKSLRAECPSPG